MTSFYRKERPAIFNSRFQAPAPPTYAWSLKSHLIFKAKKSNKVVTVVLSGKSIKVTCEVVGTDISLKVQGSSSTIKIAESEIAGLLQSKDGNIRTLALGQLCKDHANSSTSSIFISGCIVNNFARSSAYGGHKLCLELKARRPFANPFVSGLEKEYLLVGEVNDTDCKLIKYFGETKENLNEIVNFYGSLIPRRPR